MEVREEGMEVQEEAALFSMWLHDSTSYFLNIMEPSHGHYIRLFLPVSR